MSDRTDLRALVEQYAYFVDALDGDALAALFVQDGELVVPDTRRSLEPSIVVRGRPAIAEGLEVLRRFDATMHVVAGQVLSIEADRATGVVSGLAHHIRGSTDTVWFLRYFDHYVRPADRWQFERRELRVDWISKHSVEQVRDGERPGREQI